MSRPSHGWICVSWTVSLLIPDWDPSRQVMLMLPCCTPAGTHTPVLDAVQHKTMPEAWQSRGSSPSNRLQRTRLRCTTCVGYGGTVQQPGLVYTASLGCSCKWAPLQFFEGPSARSSQTMLHFWSPCLRHSSFSCVHTSSLLPSFRKGRMCGLS